MVIDMTQGAKQNYTFGLPEAGKIAVAVRDIIKSVKADHVVSNTQLGDLFGVSKDTVDRLEVMTTQKIPASVIYMIGENYGAEYIQPYMDLFGCRAVKKVQSEIVDALPTATMFAAKLAAAVGPGRTEIDHNAIADIMPTLRAIEALTSKLRAKAVEFGIAA